MLTQLIADAQATAAAAPAVVDAAAAVTADLAAPTSVDLAKLSTDAAALSTAATALATAATALNADLQTLPQATALKASHDEIAAKLEVLAKEAAGITRLQNIICLIYTGYNIYAGFAGLPTLTPPAYCTGPAPTPAHGH